MRRARSVGPTGLTSLPRPSTARRKWKRRPDTGEFGSSAAPGRERVESSAVTRKEKAERGLWLARRRGSRRTLWTRPSPTSETSAPTSSTAKQGEALRGSGAVDDEQTLEAIEDVIDARAAKALARRSGTARGPSTSGSARNWASGSVPARYRVDLTSRPAVQFSVLPKDVQKRIDLRLLPLAGNPHPGWGIVCSPDPRQARRMRAS